MRTLVLRLLAVCALGGALGCGGGLPLWYGPKTRGVQGRTQFGGGASASFLAFGTANSVRRAQAVEASGNAPRPDVANAGNADFTDGALAIAGSAPGFAPGVTARAELGSDFEAGLLYTGRSGRVDLRRSFRLGLRSYASFGAAVFAHLPGQPDSRRLSTLALSSLRGYGAEVPALIGIVDNDQNYGVWGGLRAGGEWFSIARRSSEPREVHLGLDPVTLDATRFYAGPTVGGSVGIRRLHLIAELSANFETLQGRYGSVDGSVRGLTLTPSTALLFEF